MPVGVSSAGVKQLSSGVSTTGLGVCSTGVAGHVGLLPRGVPSNSNEGMEPWPAGVLHPTPASSPGDWHSPDPHLPLHISSDSASFSAGVWHHLLDRRDANPPTDLVEVAPPTDFIERAFSPVIEPSGDLLLVQVVDVHLPSDSKSPLTLVIPFCLSHLI